MKGISKVLAAAVGFMVAGQAMAIEPGVESFKTGSNPAAGQYSTGNLVGQGPTVPGWTGNWLEAFGGISPQNVIPSSLSFSNGSGTVPTAGGSVQTDPQNNSTRAGRLLSQPVDGSTVQTVYMSFLMQAQNTAVDGLTYAALELHEGGFDDGGNRRFHLGVGDNLGSGQSPNYFVRLFNQNDFGFAADLGPNDGNVNLFVVKFTFGDQNDQDAISVWRNPSNLVSEAGSTANYVKDTFNLNFDRTSLARFGQPGTVTFDEIRFGSTWQSVTGVPEPASLSLLALGAMSLMGRRRKA